MANPFIAEGKTPAEVIAIISDMCMSNNDNLVEVSPSIVVCEAQAKDTPGSAFLGSLLYGARRSQMKMIMRTVALPHPAGARVRLQITMEADRGGGSIDRHDWSANWKKIMPRTVEAAGLIPETEYRPSEAVMEEPAPEELAPESER
ncbi:MAG: hypothetical protein WCZ66_09255 [Sphingomonadaceae bacterium]